MALALDASSPATGTKGASGTTVTTQSFTAPANALIVASVMMDSGTSFSTTATVTDSGSLTWTRSARSNFGTSGQESAVDVYWAVTTSSAARTVTATLNAAYAAGLSVKVFTDSNGGTPSMGNTAVNGMATAPTINVTTSGTNSWVWATYSDWQVNQNPTAGTSQTISTYYHEPTLLAGAVWYQNNTTASSGTVVTMNMTSPSTGTTVNIAGWEVKAGVPSGPASPAFKYTVFNTSAFVTDAPTSVTATRSTTWDVLATGLDIVAGAFSSNTATNTKSITLSPPANIVQGDLMVAVLHQMYSGDSSGDLLDWTTVPSGWTLVTDILTGSGGDNHHAMYVKAYSRSDTTYTWTMSESANDTAISGAIQRYSGADATVVASGATNDTTATTFTTPAVSTTGTDQWVIGSLGVYWGSSHPTTATGGATERLEVKVADDSTVWLADRAPGAVGSYSITGSTTKSTTARALISAVIKPWATSALTSVTATRSTSWNTAAPVTSTRATTWRALAPVAQTRSTTWSVLSAATATRATTWTVRTALTATRATTWHASAVVAAQRATLWHVRAQVGPSARATLWNVSTALTATRATTWRVLAPVTATRATTWDVQGLTSVTATRATSWAVRSQVLQTRSTLWHTAATLTSTRQTSWTTLAALSGTRATSWSVGAAVSTSRASMWHTLAPTTATRATTWTVRTALAAPATRSTLWTVRTSTTATRASQWNVASTIVSVTATRSSSWNVIGRITSDRSTSWETRATLAAPSTRSTLWHTTARVTPSTRATTWHVRASVTSTRTTTFTVKASLTADRSTTWHTTTRVTPATRSSLWAVLSTLATPSEISSHWRVGARITSTVATTWNVEITLQHITVLGVTGPTTSLFAPAGPTLGRAAATGPSSADWASTGPQSGRAGATMVDRTLEATGPSLT